MPKITVINSETGEETSFRAGYGANLRQAARYQDIEIYKGMNKYLNCRGLGACAKCLVEVEPMENVDAHTLVEKIHKVQSPQKLGCRVSVYGDITIRTAIQD